MIVLNVTYKCKENMREAFLEAIWSEGIDVASRAEAGNIKYDYYLPTENDNEVFLLEKWQDAEAVKVHSEQAHFKRLGEHKATYVEDTVIERYEI